MTQEIEKIWSKQHLNTGESNISVWLRQLQVFFCKCISKVNATNSKCKTTFLLQYTGSFPLLCSLPARHTDTQGTGWHQNNINVQSWSGWEVIVEEPTWTQVGYTLFQSSLVFSRFNLKHKQRPTPSKKACSQIKQAMMTEQNSTCTIHSH